MSRLPGKNRQMARKPEQIVWDDLRTRSGSRILFQRHEDYLSEGVPDLSGVIYRTQFWCELKASRGLESLKLRQRQLNWMDIRHAAGIPCMLLVRRAPGEWAGCPLSRDNWEWLSNNITNTTFDDIRHLGAFDSVPHVLIQDMVRAKKAEAGMA